MSFRLVSSTWSLPPPRDDHIPRGGWVVSRGNAISWESTPQKTIFSHRSHGRGCAFLGWCFRNRNLSRTNCHWIHQRIHACALALLLMFYWKCCFAFRWVSAEGDAGWVWFRSGITTGDRPHSPASVATKQARRREGIVYSSIFWTIYKLINDNVLRTVVVKHIFALLALLRSFGVSAPRNWNCCNVTPSTTLETFLSTTTAPSTTALSVSDENCAPRRWMDGWMGGWMDESKTYHFLISGYLFTVGMRVTGGGMWSGDAWANPSKEDRKFSYHNTRQVKFKRKPHLKWSEEAIISREKSCVLGSGSSCIFFARFGVPAWCKMKLAQTETKIYWAESKREWETHKFHHDGITDGYFIGCMCVIAPSDG